jgi:hypothetical protein
VGQAIVRPPGSPSKFTLRVAREAGESPEQWRARAIALAHREVEGCRFVLESLRLTAGRGGPTIAPGASVITVAVRAVPRLPRADAPLEGSAR